MNNHDSLYHEINPFYKTSGTTPVERWKDRVRAIMLLLLGWVVGGTGLVVALIYTWHSEMVSLWTKAILTTGDLFMLSALVWMTAEVAYTFRTDWIHYKDRKENP